ncbi:MAG: phosphomannomutase/phosphoglucomutase [Candidatus Micrarchaeia archaeon]
MEETVFREYDLRGRVGTELNAKTMNLIARAFGSFLLREGVAECVVGRDSRPSSEELCEAALQGLLSTGLLVTDIGVTVTPCLYFAQHYLRSRGGFMVTASHNPNEWNGVKLADDFSKTLLGPEIAELKRIIREEDFVPFAQGVLRRADVKEAYLSDVSRRVRVKKKLKVVVDCGNGTASDFTPEALERAGCEVIPLYCEVDPSFPNHFPNPELREAKQALSKKVVQEKADLGIGVDGDGDRLGVVDEKGENVWSDRLMILLARQVLERKPGATIVFDVKCTRALQEDIQAHGGKPIMWKTGHSYIQRKAVEANAPFAGERSGHFFYWDNYYGFDDATYAALRLAEYLSGRDETLSQLLQTTPHYFTSPTIHATCPDEKKYGVVEALAKEFKKEYEVNEVNGARVEFSDGWGLVRASSNEPALVLVFEAKTRERLQEIKQLFREKLSRFKEVSLEWRNE